MSNLYYTHKSIWRLTLHSFVMFYKVYFIMWGCSESQPLLPNAQNGQVTQNQHPARATSADT